MSGRRGRRATTRLCLARPTRPWAAPRASIPHFTRTSSYGNYSGSTKITTHLDHISHCKTASGTNCRTNGPTAYLSQTVVPHLGVAGEGRRLACVAPDRLAPGRHRAQVSPISPGRVEITSHLDHISHFKTASGTNWSDRWTYRQPDSLRAGIYISKGRFETNTAGVWPWLSLSLYVYVCVKVLKII